jgi:hypothetical protein
MNPNYFPEKFPEIISLEKLEELLHNSSIKQLETIRDFLYLFKIEYKDTIYDDLTLYSSIEENILFRESVSITIFNLISKLLQNRKGSTIESMINNEIKRKQEFEERVLRESPSLSKKIKMTKLES